MDHDPRLRIITPRSVAEMMSLSVVSLSDGRSETFGIRWNCTESQESAYEQPCDRFVPVSGDTHAACSRVVWYSLNIPLSMISHLSAGTPSSSQAHSPTECSWVRSPWMFMNSGPYLSFPIIFSGGDTKLVPAKFASKPMARSSSVG